METDDLIEQLSEDARPVRRLAPPWAARARLAAVAPAGGARGRGLFMAPAKSPAMALGDPRMVVEALAMLATAVTAAIAAFASEVPGVNRRWLWLPLLPLAVWLASLGQGCLADYQRSAPRRFDAPPRTAAWCRRCSPASCRRLAIFVMVRRGAPMMPRDDAGACRRSRSARSSTSA